MMSMQRTSKKRKVGRKTTKKGNPKKKRRTKVKYK